MFRVKVQITADIFPFLIDGISIGWAHNNDTYMRVCLLDQINARAEIAVKTLDIGQILRIINVSAVQIVAGVIHNGDYIHGIKIKSRQCFVGF